MRFDNKKNKQRATKVVIGELSGVTVPAVTGSNATMRKYASANTGDTEFQTMAKAVFNDVIVEAIAEQDNREQARQEVEAEFDRMNAAESVLWTANREAFDNGNAEQVRQNVRQYAEFLISTFAISSSEGTVMAQTAKQGEDLTTASIREQLSGASGDERTALIGRLRAQYLRENPGSELPDLLKSGDGSMTPEEISKMQDDLAKAQALAKMTDAQKQHFNSLPETGDTREKFLKMSSDEQTATIELAKMGEETYVTSSGATLTKSALGAELYAVMKSQDEELVKLRGQQDMATFVKQAEAPEYAHLPGTPLEKGAMLKSMQQLPEEVRKSIDASLKAGNTAMAKSFNPQAAQGNTMCKADDELESLAKAHAEEKGMTFAKAYDYVLTTAKGKELYSQMQNGE